MSIHLKHELDSLRKAVADNLLELRRKRGLSRAQLAGICGVSKAMLTQIEQQRTNPSIATLGRIANVLGVTIAKLVEETDIAEPRAIHIEDVPNLWTGAPGSTAKLLQGLDGNTLVEFWDWSLQPGQRHVSSAHPNQSREIIYVLDGELSIVVSSRQVVLTSGHSLQFRANRAHQYENTGSKLVRFFIVVVEADASRQTLG